MFEGAAEQAMKFYVSLFKNSQIKQDAGRELWVQHQIRLAQRPFRRFLATELLMKLRRGSRLGTRNALRAAFRH
jgi:predicted 3-demethylubiquinone-9 3-methyltransferase (glyoxalase superfamily)